MKSVRTKSGFTLVELVISISIIAILAVLVLARYGEKRKDANMAYMKESIHSAANAAELFRGEYDNVIAVGGSGVSSSTSLAGSPASGSILMQQIFSGVKSNTAGSSSYATKIQKTPSTDYTLYYEAATYTGVDGSGNPVYGTATLKTANANCYMLRGIYIDPSTLTTTELLTVMNGVTVSNTTIDCKL